MARLPRLNLAEISQHIIQRVNNRQVCFIEEQDYKVYLVPIQKQMPTANVSLAQSAHY